MLISRRRFIRSGTIAGLAGLSGCLGRQQLAFPELRAKGGAGDLGLAQGRAFADQISYNLRFYTRWLSEAGDVGPERLLALAGRFVPVLGERFPDLAEEIEGIAIGARLSTEEVALINARTDLLAVVEGEVRRRRIPACTSLALLGRADGGPALALGQNWDWDPLMARAPVVLRFEPANAPALVTLTEAGMLAKIGFNEHRLGVCLNFLSHVTDGRPGEVGVPIHCLLRAVLTRTSIDQVPDLVAASPRCASANFLLGQHAPRDPRALDLEITPDEVAQLEPTGGRLVHTNHFLSPQLARGCTSGRGPSTVNRLAKAEELAREPGRDESDPVRRLQEILVCRHGLPYPISRDRNPDPSSSTLSGIIMDLTRNRLVLTNGPPHANPWIERPGVG